MKVGELLSKIVGDLMDIAGMKRRAKEGIEQ
jgi:hypothetical protein